MGAIEPGLRERTRRAVRGELLLAAWTLFLEQGFENTTMDQIASATGMSRRSLFRYFSSKDDILSGCLATIGAEIAETLRDVPEDVAPWPSIRRAFEPLIARMSDDKRALAMIRLMMESPALQAEHEQKVTNWRQGIARVLSTRLASTLTDHDRLVQADALSGAALACLTSAQNVWLASEGSESLSDLLNLAMQSVSPIE